MARATWIPGQLARWGVNFSTVAGWETRGSVDLDPRVVVMHHTASNANGGPTPAMALVVLGNRTVPGPLCNILIGRDASVWVIAAGRSNNAGLGSWLGWSGNFRTVGVECENDGRGEPWPAEQSRVAMLVACALRDGIGVTSAHVCDHKEWAPTRKIDRSAVNPATFRATLPAFPHSTPPEVRVEVCSLLPELAVGSVGQHVAKAQAMLNVLIPEVLAAHGVDLAADGVYGNVTGNAVRLFQEHHQIPTVEWSDDPTKVRVGRDTWTWLVGFPGG